VVQSTPWLTIDLLVIVVSLAIISVFIIYLDYGMVGVGWQPLDKRP
jgi:hypothetical protein